MKRRLPLAKALAVLIVILLVRDVATSQATKGITGATATVKELNLDHGTATIEIVNVSTKDITAYSVAVEAVYENGHKDRSERMLDYGTTMLAKGEVLHPGQTSIQPGSWAPRRGNPLSKVNVRIAAVVYADQTAEASDAGALGRIVDHRTSMALMDRATAKILQASLADPTEEHPSLKAASAAKELAVSNRAGIGKEYMKAVSEDFERAPSEAARVRVSERQYFAERLAEMQQRAEDEERYAQIRRP